MYTIEITNLEFSKLFEREKILNTISPEGVSGTFNVFVKLEKENKVTFSFKDSASYVELDIPAQVTFGKKGEQGILLEFQKVLYILHSYTPEDLSSLKIEITIPETKMEGSSVVLKMKKDKINLPHSIAPSSLVDEYKELTDSLNYNPSAAEDFVWASLTEEEKSDVLKGFMNGLQFVSPDEQKNNAVALYLDKIIVNDRRHVYLYKFDLKLKNNIFNKALNGMIPIHKKITKTLAIAALGDSLVEFVIKGAGGDFKLVYLKSENLRCVLNNSLSNIVPPSDADLKKIFPSGSPITISGKNLLETSKFFSGLYNSSATSSDWNPIALESRGIEDELVVSLKDSGAIGYNSCSVERILPCHQTMPEEFSVLVINDSLKAFLLNAGEIDIVKIRIAKEANEPAIHLSVDKSEIYLVKLV